MHETCVHSKKLCNRVRAGGYFDFLHRLVIISVWFEKE